MFNFKKEKGFTLAEVLVTLGIVGVVSALTLPNLMSNYKNKTYVAQLQRTCNILSTAAARLMKDEEVDKMRYTSLYLEPAEGHEDEVDPAFSDIAENFFKTYFKVLKLCGFENNGCYGTSYKGLDKNAGGFPTSTTKQYCAKVDNGAVICISNYTFKESAEISIDVNGAKAPNVLGRDAFNLLMDDKGTLKESAEGGSRHSNCGVSGMEYGSGCFDKIVRDGWRMDY